MGSQGFPFLQESQQTSPEADHPHSGSQHWATGQPEPLCQLSQREAQWGSQQPANATPHQPTQNQVTLHCSLPSQGHCGHGASNGARNHRLLAGDRPRKVRH